jgi:hypothetical protein
MRIHYEEDLGIMKFEAEDHVLGLSKMMNSDGLAVIDGHLWRVCSLTKTAWPTGFARTEAPSDAALPDCLDGYVITEKHVPTF